MTSIKRRSTTAAMTAAVALLASAAYVAAEGPAHAATAHAGSAKAAKTFTFVTAATELKGKPAPQVGLFHGAIDGGGKDVPRAQSDVVHLAGGSITVKHPDSQSTFVPKIDQSTCYLTFTISGKFSLTHGTARYHGIGGSGTYRGHGYGYLQRKQNGSCNTNAQPKSEVFWITGKGKLG